MRSIRTDERFIRLSIVHRLRSVSSSAIALTIVTSSIFTTSREASANPAVLPAVGACIANPQCVATVVVVGGVAYHQLTQSGVTTWIPLAPMLGDPEAKTEDWSDDIFANSQGEANRKCQERAEAMTHKDKVLTLSKGATHIKGKLYSCQFSTEVKS